MAKALKLEADEQIVYRTATNFFVRVGVLYFAGIFLEPVYDL